MNGLTQSTDPQTEWLYHAPPVGLVLGANIIREDDLMPQRQSAVNSAAVHVLLRDGEDGAALADHWAFFTSVLGWEAKYVAGAPGGPELPTTLTVSIPEHEIALSPDLAVRDLGTPDGFQLLVKIHPNEDADKRGVLAGWEATPHQQLERLLRETGVSIGVLVDREHIRIIYAPRGETSGWQTFPLRSLATVAGRAMLGGLKLLLGHARLFTEPENLRLPKLLARSREAQNKVSAELAKQVLGALHELLRAFHAADNERIERLVASNPHHLYEGLLTTLMRLVFLLYAEDRELMPTKRTGEGVEIYEQGYSVRGLYARLVEDRALNPDTMDERLGGWGQMLALFRLVHGGHRSGWITARGGKLFDPNEFPFLEGREIGQPLSEAKVLPVRDGAILRVLEGLMTLEARSITGEMVRERLSYRSLDVEQIGSVYETVMGFTVLRASSLMIAVKGEKNLPVFVEIEALAAQRGSDRQKLLKEAGVSPSGKKLEAIKKANGSEELKAALLAIVDERGSPGGYVAQVGAPVLQPTDERRRSGSHYTPRSLTEPIVRYVLEPAFERIGELATPDQVLEIKICDPACGSGAFLVEASRQLGARLEKAWARYPELKSAIPPDEEDDIHARRLVAQRCLYGVDKNPMAVDLARLSLWLATLAREHEFTFLDHGIKCGDSLVGLSQSQIQAANWDTSKPGLPLLRGLVRDRVNEIIVGRREIQFAPDDVARSVQEARYEVIERRLEQPRVYGNAIIAAFFSSEKPRERERKRAEVESLLSAAGSSHWEKIVAISSTLKRGKTTIVPFHWEMEFPEVFERDNPGFDCVVGNPPFMGGRKLSAELGDCYVDWLSASRSSIHGNGDLVAHFFRKAFELIRAMGSFGLIATKTIGQGETRSTGLEPILLDQGQIYRAVRRIRWPGEATVVVSVVHIAKSHSSRTDVELDARPVRRISAYLVEGDLDSSPMRLAQNANTAFQGSIPLGRGFVFDDRASVSGSGPSTVDKEELVRNNPKSASRIFPYLVGENVNDDPRQAASRFIIDLDNMPLEKARKEYGDLVGILERYVKPDRAKQKREDLRQRWWQFAYRKNILYEAIKNRDRVTICSQATKHIVFARVHPVQIFDQKVIVIARDDFGMFGALSSRVHGLWVEFFASTLGETFNYSTVICFEAFPFPEIESSGKLEAVGKMYDAHRSHIMVARNEGLTKTYNRFHDVNDNATDIVQLRNLHLDMDRAMLSAYGWEDLADRAEPRFLNAETEDDHLYQGRLSWSSDFRDEVLARLLKINAERHAEQLRQGVVPDSSEGRESDEFDNDDLE